MNLRPKTIRFIIEAIDYRIEAYQERLKAEDLDEDEESDITNDEEFLEAIRTELAQTLKKSDRSFSASSNTPSEGVKDTFLEELVKTVLQLSIDERLLLVDAITSSIRQEFKQRQSQGALEEYRAATVTVAVVAS